MAKSSFLRSLCRSSNYGTWPDLGLLITRLTFGGMMIYLHGWGKFAGFNEQAAKFADPIGIGSKPSLMLVIFAEVVCAALVMVGLMTRLATVPLIINMSVAFFIFHRADPLARKELAALYLAVWVMLLLTGPGRFSLDSVIGGAGGGGGRGAQRPAASRES